MPTVPVNGVRLWVEEYGDGPVVLGVHGSPSAAALWRDAAMELGRAYRAVIYDRRGYGRSEPPRPFEATDLAEQVDDAAGLIGALGAGPAAIIGRSTGGQIALALAHRHPASVRALVLLEPALFTAHPAADAWARRLRETVLAEAAADPRVASESVIRNALGGGAWEALPDAVRDELAAGAEAVLAEMRGAGLDLSADPLRLDDEDLAAIDVPTLLVSAEDSAEALHLVNQRLAERLPRSVHAMIPGGHLISPAHRVVIDFLDAQNGRRRVGSE